MSQVIQIPNICEFMNRHLMDVFETMLTMRAVPKADFAKPYHEERVTGSIAFAGEHISGSVYLHLATPFANQMATAMLGLGAENLRESDVNDVVGEVTNMLTGGLKSWLCDSGADCAVGTPAIIRGTAFVIEPMPDVQRERLVFDCNHHRIVVEMHVKVS